ncbi:hypothetical protein Q1695_014768 [Nippostrongylus brasiliensis]|nr:hypothetical protein Q1695_014768 [Nippostrongylus brasiliensis]
MLFDTSITPVNGDSRPEFENVRKLFSNMLQHDNEGATLAVLHRGKLLVNLYGGCADSSKNQGWTKNTMAVAYSSTKIWAGLVAAILAGRKQLNYDQKASESNK